MQTIPNSTLYLCKNVDLDPNYNYTIDFDNITAQANYFDSKIASEFEINEGYSYVRDTQAIKVQAKVDDLLGINYLFYNNGNKRYYAFITKKEYVSETCTKIDFKLDVLQSFMFNYEIDESFIEREHQNRFLIENNNLKPIYNTKTENLERGESYKVVSKETIKETTSTNEPKYWVEMITTEPISTQNYSTDQANFSDVLKIDNVDTGYYVYLCPYRTGTNYFQGFDEQYYEIQNTFLGTNMHFNKSTAVLSIRVIDYAPFKYELINNDRYIKVSSVSVAHAVIAGNTNFGGIDLSKSPYNSQRWINLTNIDTNAIFQRINLATINPISFSNNISINNFKNISLEPKLYTKDYRYRFITNGRCEPLNVYNEYIDEPKTLKYICDCGINYKSKFYLNNYLGDNGKSYNGADNSINELPLLTEAYINYISQNKANSTTGVAVNIGSKVIAGAGAIIGGAASGGLGLVAGIIAAGSTALSVANTIGGELTKIQDLKDTPDNLRKAGNNATFDMLDNNFKLKIYDIEINDEYKNTIFNYFYHYGYKCNDFKKPNTRSRYYFNYIKSIGANIKSNIDSEYRNEIANIYDKGITIWHYRNAQTFKGVNNYDYENVETNLMEE